MSGDEMHERSDEPGALAVVVGSAFDALPELELRAHTLQTPFGEATVHRLTGTPHVVLFRHGLPHRWLPHQIPYRAQCWALHHLGVRAALLTSSVGLLDPTLPAFTPMLVRDLVWLDQRMPDGSAATMFVVPDASQGHLVLRDGLLWTALRAQLRELAAGCRQPLPQREVLFWYAPGPRTKTRAENRLLAGLGLEVNSMTLAPEAVLLNELGVATAAVVVGHKVSGAADGAPDAAALAESLARSLGAPGATAAPRLGRGNLNHVRTSATSPPTCGWRRRRAARPTRRGASWLRTKPRRGSTRGPGATCSCTRPPSCSPGWRAPSPRLGWCRSGWHRSGSRRRDGSAKPHERAQSSARTSG